MITKALQRRVILLIYLAFSLFTIHIIEHYKEIAVLPKLIFASSKTQRTLTYTPKLNPLKSFKAPILVYHYVEYVQDEKDTIRKSLNIVPSVFTAQVETLKNAGYTFITPKEIAEILDGRKKLPQKPIVLSFDDGYRDFYTDVFPILKKYNIKSIIYVVSGFLDKPNYLLIEQLKEIAESGLVEIGAHTVNHAVLKGIPLEMAKYEIEESKKQLENLLNISVVSFAYPHGQFDNQVINLIKDAGFRSAVTTTHGFEINHENKYSLYRIHPGNKTDTRLLNSLEQN